MEQNSYSEAKTQLINLFKKRSDYGRRIVFWYDASKNFYEDIKDDTFDNAKIVIYNNNPFSVKTLLEIEDTKSNYLIYFPCEKPKDRKRHV